MTTNDLDAMNAALDESPLDADLRRVLADAYDDAGDAEKAEYQRAFAAILCSPLNTDLAERIDAAVAKANGKMRARTLSEADACRCVRRAICYALHETPVPAAYVDGGGVANSYGYAAQTALVLAVVREDGRVCVDGGQAQARKGGGSPANVWRELKQWKEGEQLAARLEAWAKVR